MHRQVDSSFNSLNIKVDQIVNTLLGKQVEGGLERKGGLVADVKDIKNNMKSRLSGKEKATVLIAVITGVSGIIIAILK